MNPSQLAAQASQSAQQGQDLFNSDKAQSAAAGSQYNTYQGQANTAAQNQSDYTKYMQGAGSGTNLYNTGLSNAQQMYGFDPKTLATATQNLTQSQNAQAALNQASQSSTGGYGLSGAQLGSFYQSQAAPLSNQVNAQSTAVGNLTGLANTAQTQANQVAGAGLQGEQTTAKSLNDVFVNAKAQSDQALQNMQFYSQLASTQGGMNASNTKAYNDALNAYQQGQAAMAQAAASYAQAGLLSAQTVGQQQQNDIGTKNAAYAKVAAEPGSYGVLAPTSGYGMSLPGTHGR